MSALSTNSLNQEIFVRTPSICFEDMSTSSRSNSCTQNLSRAELDSGIESRAKNPDSEESKSTMNNLLFSHQTQFFWFSTYFFILSSRNSQVIFDTQCFTIAPLPIKQKPCCGVMALYILLIVRE